MLAFVALSAALLQSPADLQTHLHSLTSSLDEARAIAVSAYGNNEELAELKKLIHKDQYRAIISAFEELWNGKGREKQLPGSSNDGIAILTE